METRPKRDEQQMAQKCLQNSPYMWKKLHLVKAFDCVDHRILLSKLKLYGINGKHLALYQSYLDN
jgi:hypothetical protein